MPLRQSWMRFVGAAVAAIALGAIGFPVGAQTSGVNTVYTPGAGSVNPGAMYARTITLRHNGDANGTMLTTFETYTTSTPVFPVYKSTNGGTSWTALSQVADTVNGYGMRWNPQIYELPAPVGQLPAGTILMAGLSVPSDLRSTEILLFASRDKGATWSFLSSVAKGGAGYVSDPNTPVWEPFIMYYQGQIVVYYSDQRQNSVHSQLLDHQTSTDGLTWSAPVNDVVYPAQTARPGMTSVAAMNNGNWILSYEYCGAPEGSCPVYYKIATNPLDFNSVVGKPLVLDDGSHPCCQPHVVWTPSGGANGTIVLSNGQQLPLAINTAGGDPSAWRSQMSNAPGGYSRSLMVLPDGSGVMTVTGGYHDSNFLNKVQVALDNVAPGISMEATYQLTNVYSGLKLSVASASTLNGAQVVQALASTGREQQWVLKRQANGYFTINNVNSALVLGVSGASTTDGAAVQQQTATAGAASQEWAVVQGVDGAFTVTNRKSNALLDDYQWAKANGAPMVQWTDTGSANQRWTFTQVALPSLTTGQFTIQNGLGKYLEIPGGSTASGTQADQWWYANQNWHLWTFIAAIGGYRITNGNSGMALTDDFGNGSSVAILQRPVNTSDAKQVWSLTLHGPDQYYLTNVSTGRVVTIAGGVSTNLARAVSWPANGTSDQVWTVKRIN